MRSSGRIEIVYAFVMMMMMMMVMKKKKKMMMMMMMIIIYYYHPSQTNTKPLTTNYSKCCPRRSLQGPRFPTAFPPHRHEDRIHRGIVAQQSSPEKVTASNGENFWGTHMFGNPKMFVTSKVSKPKKMMRCFIQALIPITDGPFQSLLTAVVKGKPDKKSCRHAHYVLPYWLWIFIFAQKYIIEMASWNIEIQGSKPFFSLSSSFVITLSVDFRLDPTGTIYVEALVVSHKQREKLQLFESPCGFEGLHV